MPLAIRQHVHHLPERKVDERDHTRDYQGVSLDRPVGVCLQVFSFTLVDAHFQEPLLQVVDIKDYTERDSEEQELEKVRFHLQSEPLKVADFHVLPDHVCWLGRPLVQHPVVTESTPENTDLPEGEDHHAEELENASVFVLENSVDSFFRFKDHERLAGEILLHPSSNSLQDILALRDLRFCFVQIKLFAGDAREEEVLLEGLVLW